MENKGRGIALKPTLSEHVKSFLKNWTKTFDQISNNFHARSFELRSERNYVKKVGHWELNPNCMQLTQMKTSLSLHIFFSKQVERKCYRFYLKLNKYTLLEFSINFGSNLTYFHGHMTTNIYNHSVLSEKSWNAVIPVTTLGE